jgi:hypothetical protein
VTIKGRSCERFCLYWLGLKKPIRSAPRSRVDKAEVRMDSVFGRRDPETMSGALCFSGTRVPVKNLFDYLECASSSESLEHDITTGFGVRFGRICRDNFIASMTSEIKMIYRRMCRTSVSEHDLPSWPFVASRTLIGGSSHQTRIASDLCELLVIASNPTGACRLPPAFRRP